MLRPLVYVLILTAALPAHAANERAIKSLRHWQAVQYRQHYYQGTAPLPGSYWRSSTAPTITSQQNGWVSATVKGNFSSLESNLGKYRFDQSIVTRLRG